jgi:hypothetical protein
MKGIASDCFTLSRYDRHAGKFAMEEAPVYRIID